MALDNLILLLHPHHPTHEGFEAFVRAILKFTSNPCCRYSAGDWLWSGFPLPQLIARRIGWPQANPVVFMGGVSVTSTTAALSAVHPSGTRSDTLTFPSILIDNANCDGIMTYSRLHTGEMNPPVGTGPVVFSHRRRAGLPVYHHQTQEAER